MVSCIYTGLHVQHPLHLSDLMKLEFSRQVLEKSSNMNFHENPSRRDPSCSMRTNKETEKHDGAHGRFS